MENRLLVDEIQILLTRNKSCILPEIAWAILQIFNWGTSNLAKLMTKLKTVHLKA